ncbi:hypothetical protein DUI87_25634 [Hirundo rustica rustica]|uniref:EGF-like domain-containing protein n=1 Tax=Hirundo rustica rustica TaxID=333673 RepID=A0A3M0JBG8_HIRRU|nr:hypothetical protein DUI87_25634 [Hirundo rustica rustica]
MLYGELCADDEPCLTDCWGDTCGAEDSSGVPAPSQASPPSNTPALAESWSPSVSAVAKCEPMQMEADIDECAAKMHYCHANTVCVNLPGSYRCDCVTGYVRVDDFSCTEHDECGSGQHSCDENAICTNTIRGHSCTCKPGYVGNGTICRGIESEECSG